MALTQEENGQATYQYGHVILFEWDPDIAAPFKIYPVEDISEFKECWLAKRRTIEARRKTYKFSALDGIETSVFAKVQKG